MCYCGTSSQKRLWPCTGQPSFFVSASNPSGKTSGRAVQFVTPPPLALPWKYLRETHTRQNRRQRRPCSPQCDWRALWVLWLGAPRTTSYRRLSRAMRTHDLSMRSPVRTFEWASLTPISVRDARTLRIQTHVEHRLLIILARLLIVVVEGPYQTMIGRHCQRGRQSNDGPSAVRSNLAPLSVE